MDNFHCACVVCGDNEPIVLHPYQGFTSRPFGEFNYPDFALCGLCEVLWQGHALGLLSRRFMEAHYHVFRNQTITAHEAYGLFCSLELAVMIKSN